MKLIKYTLLGLTLLGLLTFTSCGKDDTPPTPQVDPEQEIVDGLNKSWTITSVTLDNVDVTGDWNGFTLTFNGTKEYTATALSAESILVWPASGSYTFPNATNANLILRNDDIQITISNMTDTTVTLSFTILGRTGGRKEGLIGGWVFEMRS